MPAAMRQRAVKLLLLLLNLAALAFLAASGLVSPFSETPYLVQAVPAPTTRLVAGDAFTAQADMAQAKDKTGVLEAEVSQIIDAIMDVRRDLGLLAENADHLKKRVELVERALGIEPLPEQLEATDPAMLPTQ